MNLTALRHVSLCLVASAAIAGCATNSDNSADDPEAGSLSEAALSNSEQTAFNYFVSKGLTKVQSAGVVGNLMQESSVNPASVEFGGGPGRGIAQWSVGGRWDTSKSDNATWYASAHKLSRGALNTQLDFIWYELTTFSGYGLAQLKAATTVTAAVAAFQDKFEICGTCDSSKRITYAQQALSAYGGGSSGNTGAGCFSNTLGKEMPDNACVQSKSDDLWYQCSNGAWVDRWTDPDACNGVHAL
ncbi:MAG TPA: phage tail tip lysozyme [Kofleriaceae bacterium]|nr:phage tail tip lysozyme [Kofleriaceae bacterium]